MPNFREQQLERFIKAYHSLCPNQNRLDFSQRSSITLFDGFDLQLFSHCQTFSTHQSFPGSGIPLS
jgi:hypothetical protein